jgi:uncharacterized protein (TIGR02466 family)
MRKILNLFSTPVLEANLQEIDNSYLEQEINNVFANMPVSRVLSDEWRNNLETPGKNPKGYSTFNDPTAELLDNPKFNNFFEIISNVFNEFFLQLDCTSGWQFENSWASVYPKGAYVDRHNHGTAHWSGVYYVAVPDPEAIIRFDDPKEYSLNHEPHNCRFRGRMQHVFYPTAGKLLLWPGYLYHSSIPNNCDQDRIIISFNINTILNDQ